MGDGAVKTLDGGAVRDAPFVVVKTANAAQRDPLTDVRRGVFLGVTSEAVRVWFLPLVPPTSFSAGGILLGAVLIYLSRLAARRRLQSGGPPPQPDPEPWLLALGIALLGICVPLYVIRTLQVSFDLVIHAIVIVAATTIFCVGTWKIDPEHAPQNKFESWLTTLATFAAVVAVFEYVI
jgi:hypothetical protein